MIVSAAIPDESNTGTNLKQRFQVIEELIDDLVTLEGIHGVILFRIDGLVLLTHFSVEVNQNLLEITSWINNIVQKVSLELREDIQGISYAKPEYNVFFYKCGDSGILSCIVDSYANHGLLAIEMDKVAFRIKGQLE